MNEEKKARRKKLAIRYLILAACILVVAAVTVTTVFAANDWFKNDITIDQGNQGNQGNNGDDNKNPVTPGNPDDDNPSNPDDGKDKPTSSDTSFAQPVATLNVCNPYDFGKDVSLGHWHFHTGLDLAATAGTNVVACLDGTVENVVVDDKLDGTTVTIAHANGLKTVYSFINLKDSLKKGDSIKKGQVIGTVADPCGSEFKQEAHLHFEVVKDGEKTDPTPYLDIAEK